MPREKKTRPIAADLVGTMLETERPADYAVFIEDLKGRIRQSQIQAHLSVSRELTELYWHIGKSIVIRQRTAGWGAAVIDRVATDLQAAFPGQQGFSRSNIWRMRAFCIAYAGQEEIRAQSARAERDPAKLAQLVRDFERAEMPSAVTQIPWGHNVILVEKLKDTTQRLWYAQQTSVHGWSRAVLAHQIESGLYERQGKAITNFEKTLPAPQSDLAQQILKDPYNFDFLSLHAETRERELEQGLLDHLQRFLIELGIGFAFVGRQVHLEVGGEDYYLDLLFYHLRLRCFVVIDLKAVPFKPEFAGKMNFYLSAVDDRYRHQEDQPSIGLIICKTRDKTIVEYALRDTAKPIGVSAYRITRSLPKNLKGNLPTIDELEAELGG